MSFLRAYPANRPTIPLYITRPSIRSCLIISWIVLIYITERAVFSSHLSQCEWDRWESWPSGASPHRVALIADPQLVDPHTYPTRPWPLDSLTMTYSDQFIRRSYDSILDTLDPDTIFFLGDLFDGGREWSTRDGLSVSPNERWRKYENSYWISELVRFGTLFFNPLSKPRSDRSTSGSRKVVASLPGNHDVGIGSGVQLPVRDRFVSYFGNSNRVDVAGNHSFISIDGLSLTAMDIQPPEDYRSIWEPVSDFLDGVDGEVNKAVQREVDWIYDRALPAHNGLKFQHDAVQPEDNNRVVPPDSDVVETLPQVPSNAFPRIVLSHVPLYRNPGTPCGPSREKFPPSEGNPDNDLPNAIAIRRGYQYQNVLSQDMTKFVTDRIPGLQYAFSGDDHDYCDVVHQTDTGSQVREVTVKSISWAMGVRRPGFVMLSLWNPVGQQDGYDGTDDRETLKIHLCLLPDQLGLFIRYACFLVFTVVVLILRAHSITGHTINPLIFLVDGLKKVITTLNFDPDSEPLLPIYEAKDTVTVPIGKLSIVPIEYPSPGGSSVNASPFSGFGLRPASSSISSPADTPVTAGIRGHSNRRRSTLSKAGGVNISSSFTGGSTPTRTSSRPSHPRSTIEYLKSLGSVDSSREPTLSGGWTNSQSDVRDGGQYAPSKFPLLPSLFALAGDTTDPNTTATATGSRRPDWLRGNSPWREFSNVSLDVEERGWMYYFLRDISLAAAICLLWYGFLISRW